jgi:hypothetical protein
LVVEEEVLAIVLVEEVLHFEQLLHVEEFFFAVVDKFVHWFG